MTNIARRIAHLDMDAFFASVELLKYPELRGHAVVVGGGKSQQPTLRSDGTRAFAKLRDYVGRGVATTSTYEARALGVFSAMGLMKAAKMAPDCVILPSDFESYRTYSNLFKSAVARIAPVIENVGIDEIYIDLTEDDRETDQVARHIKDAVFEATGIYCSIGIASNKLLAKICSDLEKPDGLTILGDQDIPAKIWPLSVKKVNGIGPKSTAKLAELGILTIGDLANADVALLQTHFGTRYATWLTAVAHGVDSRPIKTSRPTKSISRETTFERDMHVKADRTLLSDKLTALCSKVSDDLKKHELFGKTIGVKLKFADFTIVTRDITLAEATDQPEMILGAVRECLKRIAIEKRIRLLGVRIHTFCPSSSLAQRGMQFQLFPDQVAAGLHV